MIWMNYCGEEIGKTEIILLGGVAKQIKHHEIFVACKENNYMFLYTDNFKFRDVKKFLETGMSYNKWLNLYFPTSG